MACVPKRHCLRQKSNQMWFLKNVEIKKQNDRSSVWQLDFIFILLVDLSRSLSMAIQGEFEIMINNTEYNVFLKKIYLIKRPKSKKNPHVSQFVWNSSFLCNLEEAKFTQSVTDGHLQIVLDIGEAFLSCTHRFGTSAWLERMSDQKGMD